MKIFNIKPFWASIFLICLGLNNLAAQELNPKVWIFCGLSGGETREIEFSAIVNSLENSLTSRFKVNSEDMTILSAYNSEKKTCNRENFVKELTNINKTIKSGQAVMLFFMGHANRAQGKTYFNIEGSDLTLQEIGKRIDATATSPVISWISTEFSADFFNPLSGFNRITITADMDRENSFEPHFMMALAKALESKKFEGENVEFVSIYDILMEARAKLDEFCASFESKPMEESSVDGDGDGIASRKPLTADAYPIKTLGFKINNQIKIKEEEEINTGSRLRISANLK